MAVVAAHAATRKSIARPTLINVSEAVLALDCVL